MKKNKINLIKIEINFKNIKLNINQNKKIPINKMS